MCSFGSMAGSNAAYELTNTYTPAGRLQSQHLNSLVYDRDYGWSDNGDLVHISTPPADAGIRLQRHGQAGERAHPRTGPGHPHPVCDRPGGQPPAGPGAAPGQHAHGVAG
ncbi:hypothetical protein ACLB1E_29995 [Escherichia coli]